MVIAELAERTNSLPRNCMKGKGSMCLLPWKLPSEIESECSTSMHSASGMADAPQRVATRSPRCACRFPSASKALSFSFLKDQLHRGFGILRNKYLYPITFVEVLVPVQFGHPAAA